MTRARDLANIADGTFTATDLDLSGTLTVSGDATFDTNTLFVDVSTDRVGVGTTSPVRTFSVASADTLAARIESTGSTEGFLQLAGSGTGTAPRVGATGNNFIVYTSDAERMRITSAGLVGIGTSSPTVKLEVNGGTDNEPLKIVSTDAGSYIAVADNSTTGSTRFGAVGNDFKIDVNSGERMRIDSSGNLLVGRTNTSFGNTGHLIAPSGFVYHERDGGDSVLYLNRKTSDGDLARFYKDGLEVGGIGSSVGGEILYMNGTNAGGIGVAKNANILYPVNSGGALSNGVQDIGAASYRFKDLYLSGVARIGKLLLDLDYVYSNSYTYDAAGNFGTNFATLVPNGTLANSSTYLVTVFYSDGQPPYYADTSFIFRTCPYTNAPGTSKDQAFLVSCHVSATNAQWRIRTTSAGASTNGLDGILDGGATSGTGTVSIYITQLG